MNRARVILLLFCVFFNSILFSQNENKLGKHYAGLQIGGQMMVGLHYEYAYFQNKLFHLNLAFTGGVHEFADDKRSGDKAVYGLQLGSQNLIGKKLIFGSLGFFSSTYFYKKESFTNLNAWIGLRMIFNQGFYFDLAYTPRLYTSYSDPHQKYFNSFVGFKAGINL